MKDQKQTKKQLIVELNQLRQRVADLEEITNQTRQNNDNFWKNEEKFKAHYNNFPLPIYTWEKTDDDFILAGANDAAITSTGEEINSLYGKKANEIWHDEPDLIKTMTRCYGDQSKIKCEKLYTFEDTEENLYLAITFAYIPPKYILLYTEDITEAKNAEKDIHIKESAIASSINGIAITDLEGTLTFANDSFLEMWQYSQKEMQGKHVTELWSYPGVIQEIIDSLKSKDRWIGELAAQKKDGSLFNIQLMATIVKDETGLPVCMMGSVQDITQRKKAEGALLESQEMFLTVFQNSPSLMTISTMEDDRIIDVNKSFLKTLEYNRKEIIGQSAVYSKILDDRADRKKILGQMRKEVEIRNEQVAMSSKSGKKRTMLFSNKKLIIKDKGYWLTVSEDITKRMEMQEEKARLEQQLRQSHKMEAIGTLAGGIAHDFNNTLAAIIGYSELSLLQNQENKELSSNLEQILQAGDRGKNLIKQILSFSRQTNLIYKPIDIRHIVTETVDFLKASLPSTIEIRKNIQVTSGTISADPTQMHQVLMNLCSNAAHAMRKKGGILEVNLTEAELDSRQIAHDYPDLKKGPYLKLEIKDTGHGMTMATMNRIFDPFFTTKRQGEGTGMGLSATHGIVSSHNGKITVSSEPNKGTTFHVFFPKLEREVTTVTDIFKPVTTKGEARILFVDDQNFIVDTGKQTLEYLGYKVVARTSSIEALEAFRNQPSKFDLVVTDMTMPKMTGIDLSKKLLQIRADIPIILCTGFSEQIHPEKARLLGIREMLMKPFSARELTDTIQKVLVNPETNAEPVARDKR